MKTKQPRSFIFRLASAVVLLGTLLLQFNPASAVAANLYWSTNGVLGGAGTWDTSSTVWSTSPTGPFNTAWSNANNDVAFFAGTAGIVANSTSITNGGLQFNTTAYTITNTSGALLAFGAANNTITLNGVAAATISGPVGGSGNLTLANINPLSGAGTITFNGVSTGGWSGATIVNPGMNLTTTSTSTSVNQVLNNTTGITLNGGGTVQFTRNSNTGLNAISDTAPITVNGSGTFSATSANGGSSAIENIGSVTLNSGLLNLVQTANNQNTVQLNSFTRSGTASLAISANSSAFTTAAFAVNGASATTTNAIIGPWATVGTAANAQTDYAVFDSSSRYVARNISASTVSTWPTATTPAATDNYTMSGTASGTISGGTKIVNTLRSQSTSATVSSGNTNITITGHSLNVGDVVAFSFGGNNGNLVAGQAYYVLTSNLNTVSISATAGGAVFTPSTTPSGGVNAHVGIQLSPGNNLNTYGILNPNAQGGTLNIVTNAGGTLSTPSGGGNLFITTGTGGIAINAPITDNNGNVTVVRSGSGSTLTLSGNNTFSGGLVVNAGGAGGSANAVFLSGPQSFTGGITLNGGGLNQNTSGVTAASLNNNPITVNGMAHLMVNNGETLGLGTTITINSSGYLNIGAAGNGSSFTVPGVVSGSGVLDVSANGGNYNSGNTVNLTHATNTFTGNVVYNGANSGPYNLNVNSLGDGGKVILGLSATAMTFGLNSSATAPLTFNTRQFEYAGSAGTGTIKNNSAQALNIYTDLICSGTGARTLILDGSGSGVSTFGGKISNGTFTSLSITKSGSGAGAWALTNANTYSGGTTLLAGTLNINNASAIGTGAFTNFGGTINNTSGGSISNINNNAMSWNGDFTFTGSNPLNLGTGAVTLSANRIVTVSAGTLTVGGAINGAATFTLGGNGNLILNGANTFSGKLTIGNNAGSSLRLTANSIRDFNTTPQPSALGAPTTSINGQIQLGATSNPGTLEFKGLNADQTSNRQINVGSATTGSGGAIILNNDPSYKVTLNNPNFVAGVNASGFGRFLTLGGSNTGNNTISGIIPDNTSGTIGLVKQDSGTWVVSGANTYSGATIISGGTLKLGANNTLPSSTAVTNSGGTLDTQTFTNNLGTLELTGATTINLGSGGNLNFANSSAKTWTGGTLNLTGSFVSGSSLRFGTTSGGLTGTQVGKISKSGGGTKFDLDANGYLRSLVTAPNLSYTVGAGNGQSVPLSDITVNAGVFSTNGSPVYTIISASTPSAQGGTVTFNSTNIQYTPPNSTITNDTFTYTISDGVNTSTPATVTIAFVQQSSGNASLSVSGNAASGTLFGIPGQNYGIQRSTNSAAGPYYLLSSPPLTNAVLPITAAGDGSVKFSDTNAIYPSAFYRLIQQ